MLKDLMIISYKGRTIFLRGEQAELVYKISGYLPNENNNRIKPTKHKRVHSTSYSSEEIVSEYKSSSSSEQNVEEPIFVSIYGLCSNNNDTKLTNKVASIVVEFSDNSDLNTAEIATKLVNPSNTRADMFAIIRALTTISEEYTSTRTILIHSVNKTMIDTLIDKDRTKRADRDLWNIIFSMLDESIHDIRFVHAKQGQCDNAKLTCKYIRNS